MPQAASFGRTKAPLVIGINGNPGLGPDRGGLGKGMRIIVEAMQRDQNRLNRSILWQGFQHRQAIPIGHNEGIICQSGGFNQGPQPLNAWRAG